MKKLLNRMGMSALHAVYPVIKMPYHALRRIFFPYVKVIELSPNRLDDSIFEHVWCHEEHDGILQDLIDFTGFTREQLKSRILRDPEVHHESEFRWYNPRDINELNWFYRNTASFLFANAVHHYWQKLDMIKGGRVLDFGAGAGCNVIWLAKRGLQVDFLEIGRVQADFINFRARKRGLANVTEIMPYYEGMFDPIHSVTKIYNAIIVFHVLEHIPDYHLAVEHFIAHLKPGGLILEESPFNERSTGMDIHVKASMPMKEAMDGMTLIAEGVWKKNYP
jgi:2-polyprenyl-3-methyl-5-hydroxy-6-metoxy-1,4-benzoquinol methylase